MMHQRFVGRLEAEEGQLQLLRTSITLITLGLALSTDGLADSRVPDHRK